MTDIAIEVTQEDIDNAIKAAKDYEKELVASYARAESCPIAFALKRMYPYHKVWVFANKAQLYDNSQDSLDRTLFYLYLHNDAKDFIQLADNSDANVSPTIVHLSLCSYNEGIATCDICGQSNDHKHDTSEYDVLGFDKAMYEAEHDL